MEIKRKIEIFSATRRRYVIRQSTAEKQIACTECGEPTVTVEQTAKVFDIAQRRIFKIIEDGAAHFIETDAGAVMICLSSLGMVLDDEQQKAS